MEELQFIQFIREAIELRESLVPLNANEKKNYVNQIDTLLQAAIANYISDWDMTIGEFTDEVQRRGLE